MAKITVAIPTYNRSKNLKRCLSSLVEQTFKDFHVLVIDGRSTDKTKEVITLFKNKLALRLITDKTPSLSHIRDIGWREAKGDIVAWVDDDTVLDPKWAKYVAAQLGEPKIGGVTGPTVIPKHLLRKRDVFFFHTSNSFIGKLISKFYFNLFMRGKRYEIGKIYPSGAWSPGSNFPRSRELEGPIEVDYLEACNFAISRKVLEEIDGFNLGYKAASEWCEVDLAFRIRKAGYKLIFDPRIAVEHQVSRSGVFSRRLSPASRLRNFIRFYIKTYYPKSLKGWILFSLYLNFLSIYYLCLWIKRKLS